jgi:hypothetical protein
MDRYVIKHAVLIVTTLVIGKENVMHARKKVNMELTVIKIAKIVLVVNVIWMDIALIKKKIVKIHYILEIFVMKHAIALAIKIVRNVIEMEFALLVKIMNFLAIIVLKVVINAQMANVI